MKFLWGSKGAFVAAEDRHSKFEKVLTVMAEKYCGEQISAASTPTTPTAQTTAI